MSIRNLQHLFEPQSVALIGASATPGSVGNTVLHNLFAGGFKGRIDLVNPRHSEIAGHRCSPSVSALAEPPDLAVIATPAPTIPAIIGELGGRGTRAAVVLSAVIGSELRQRMLEASRPHLLRILGPNGIGLMLPHRGLNATFAATPASPGRLALVSQSGAIITALVDWASRQRIGFSQVISLGDMAEVDFGDILDYLAGDTHSRAILLYMEALTAAPKFMSAARRAARSKPVIVIKSGRHAAAARAAASHTGRLAGEDGVYDAAFRRAGLLRALDLDELMEAAEVLAHLPVLAGERLTILTNGGGAGVLAADRLADFGGVLTELSTDLRSQLSGILPAGWSNANPVDIIGDADAGRYRRAFDVLLQEGGGDAILVIRCPTAVGTPLDAARAIVDCRAEARSRGGRNPPVLANWFGGNDGAADRLLADNGIPNFDTPGAAARGFMHLVRHARLQEVLMRTPPAIDGVAAGIDDAARIIAAERAAGNTLLTEPASKAVLAAAGIPMTPTVIASGVEEARAKAAELLGSHPAVVLKVLSPDISHKSDVGGVRLDLATAEAVGRAAAEILENVARLKPGARVDGFTLAPQIQRPGSHELIIGAKVDDTFGPVLLFGAGGVAVEVLRDTAIGLPPLDLRSAADLIAETRIARLLCGFRDRPAADLDAIAAAIVKISELIAYVPAIVELDVNPLLADQHGIMALDGRVRVAPLGAPRRQPLSLTPYPRRWQDSIEHPELGRLDIRPIRPDDEWRYPDFFANVTPEDMRLRFFTPRQELSHGFFARLTQIDYSREMAFVAVTADSGRLLGVARFVADPELAHGEFGVLIRSNLKGRGLGSLLMSELIAYARTAGLGEMTGWVLGGNTTMLDLCRKLGFDIGVDPNDPAVRIVSLRLADPVADSN